MNIFFESKQFYENFSLLQWPLIGGILLFFSLINLFFIIPPVFNFYIIPKIEKKVGKKLKFVLPVYQIMLFGKYFGRHIEIMKYILIHHLRIKWSFSDSYALARIKYPREMFSKSEIVWSFIDFFNWLIFGTVIILGIIIGPH